MYTCTYVVLYTIVIYRDVMYVNNSAVLGNNKYIIIACPLSPANTVNHQKATNSVETCKL